MVHAKQIFLLSVAFGISTVVAAPVPALTDPTFDIKSHGKGGNGAVYSRDTRVQFYKRAKPTAQELAAAAELQRENSRMKRRLTDARFAKAEEAIREGEEGKAELQALENEYTLWKQKCDELMSEANKESETVRQPRLLTLQRALERVRDLFTEAHTKGNKDEMKTYKEQINRLEKEIDPFQLEIQAKYDLIDRLVSEEASFESRLEELRRKVAKGQQAQEPRRASRANA